MRIDERINIDLGPVTVLVGANGSGKSSILKAVHWSIRCATLRDQNDNTTLEQMDYTPSRDFLQLGHKKRVQNSEAIRKIAVGFVDEENEETIIRINAARNDAAAKTKISGPLSEQLTAANSKSAYIPGLAGLAETESLLATPILHRRAASGEGGSVLRHILLGLVENEGTDEHYEELLDLNKWVQKVIPEVRFWVKFDRLRDVNIDAQFWTPDMTMPGRSLALQRKPLEMAGTGFLQVVQIFAYLLKFRPGLLLIDEPDAHLHPGTQELLIKAIEEAAREFPNTQFVLTTHSPNLVRACGEKTRVRWIENGQLKQVREDQVRQRMGWGALDKEIILFTEDSKTQYIKSVLSQWPHLERKVLIWPTFGSSSLPHGDGLKKLREELGVAVAVHRDRDFMSENDANEWKGIKKYTENNIPTWLTEGSDIESPFCNAQHIANVLDIPTAEAETIVTNAINKFDQNETQTTFSNALAGAIASIPAENRSNPIQRWNELGGFGVNTIKGKDLIVKIKEACKDQFENTENARKLGRLDKLTTPTPAQILCHSLEELLTAILVNQEQD